MSAREESAKSSGVFAGAAVLMVLCCAVGPAIVGAAAGSAIGGWVGVACAAVVAASLGCSSIAVAAGVSADAPTACRPGQALARISKRGAGHAVTGNRRSQFSVGPKRLGATGWEFVHVCVDDATGSPTPRSCPTSKAKRPPPSCAAAAWFRRFGIKLETRHERQRGLLPLARPSARLRRARHRPPHLHPALSPPHQRQGRTFIQTLNQRWARGAIYGSSAERTAALPGWLTHYNSPEDTASSATSHPQLASPS